MMFAQGQHGKETSVHRHESSTGGLIDAVLFDRDGTLVADVPYNGDPARVRPVPGARQALDRLRAAGLRLGVVSNQSGVGRGLLTPDDVARVNARVEQLLGPFDTWQVCLHKDADGCLCRKPAPGLVYAAAAALGTIPARCVVIGDIGSDVAAAMAAGASAILVPTAATRAGEVAAAPAAAGDLGQAVDLVLRRARIGTAVAPLAEPGAHVLAVRADSAGDVLVTGPAVRALAARAGRVTLLCGPRGRAAAELLPGVDQLVEWRLPWLDPRPSAVDPAEVDALVARIAGEAPDEAVIFTSFHQSPLPFALLARMAGVPRTAAVSDDYPGSLLDVRHRVPLALPEAERALSLAAAAGYPLPPGDDGALAVRLSADGALPAAGALSADGALPADGRYVVVHPGTSVPARACPPDQCARIVRALARAGHRVVVTGDRRERALTAYVAGAAGLDLGGRTTLGELAGVLARAGCAVVGNTGPAHLAAAVGTPVVSLFAPTVPLGQWGPYRVPAVRLGDPLAACRHTRATDCPVPGHPCLRTVEPGDVVAAVELLCASRPEAGATGPAGTEDRA
ncbi:MAG TPA: HAD-IIIA family hydrolase [Micromonosporaceae bacterium]|nr:HAD-IIIA family hydrolase [Micromonosporaceae bacterium]